MDTFSDRIEQVRQALGLKANAFAEQLDVPYRTYMNYKTGRTPPVELLPKLVELYDVNPSWLMTGKGDIFNSPDNTDQSESDDSDEMDEDENDFESPSQRSYDGDDDPDTGDESAIMGNYLSGLSDSAESPEQLHLKLMNHLVDLHAENRMLRQRVEELEVKLFRERKRSRRARRQ